MSLQTTTRARILDLLRFDMGYSSRQLADALGVPASGIRRVLYSLKAKGQAERESDGFWYPTLVHNTTDTPTLEGASL